MRGWIDHLSKSRVEEAARIRNRNKTKGAALDGITRTESPEQLEGIWELHGERPRMSLPFRLLHDESNRSHQRRPLSLRERILCVPSRPSRILKTDEWVHSEKHVNSPLCWSEITPVSTRCISGPRYDCDRWWRPR